MSQLQSLEDTIVAISTPLGVGALGVVRLSGKDAVNIAAQIFRSPHEKDLLQFQSFSVHFGHLVDPRKEEILDEILLTVMRAPHTYTQEDMVEISCHGSPVILRLVLDLCVEMGARLAEPGEFTKRAFINGRLDLTQAEAVLDVIHAKTEKFLRASLHQLKGDLTRELEEIREGLMDVYTQVEAVVNFPEDDTENQGRIILIDALLAIEERVSELLATSDTGRLLREGIKVVICGRPNVGKSSLLNLLLKYPRAIVSEIEGTTRDTIEESAQIKGVPIQLVDTAGILEPRDLIEEEAIKRSHLSIQSADLVLLVLDGSRDLTVEDERLIEQVKDQNVLVVINKNDLPRRWESERLHELLAGKPVVMISALQKTAISEMEEKILTSVLHRKDVDTSAVMISNVRHIHALKACVMALGSARALLEQQVSLEFVSEEIKRAINDLDSITGKDVDEDLVNRIFSDFCIGK